MTNYRDDTQETAVASNTIWGGQKTIGDDSAKISDEVTYGLRLLLSETATASDLVIDYAGHLVIETAQIADTLADHLHAAVLLEETSTGSDLVSERLLAAPLLEAAAVSDVVFDKLHSVIIEAAVISDTVLAARRIAFLFDDSAKIRDFTFQGAKVLVVDNVIVADDLFGRAHAKAFIDESAYPSDEVIDSRTGAVSLLTEAAHIADELFGKLRAHQLVIEVGEITDSVLQDGGYFGQAWTANLKSWATSRYSPYTFTSVANIDGVLYATGADGVYALSGGTENMEASLITGKVDVGQGGLVHPLWSFLEYELDGTAEMDVTQTQNGTVESYTYTLPAKQSLQLTSGRFTFGRGLRGRHFSFALRLNGRRGAINDLSVETAQTRRRI